MLSKGRRIVTINTIRYNVLSTVTSAASNSITTPLVSTYPTNPVKVGHFFRDLELKGKGHKRLNLNDLRSLLLLCNEPTHETYIKNGIRLYQSRGQDFTEDIGSHFVRACIRSDIPKLAVELCSVYENRIGAWLTPKTFHLLVLKLIEKGEIGSIIPMVNTISKKGVIANLDTFEYITDGLMKDPSQAEVLKSVGTAASKMLSEKDLNVFSVKYPSLFQ